MKHITKNNRAVPSARPTKVPNLFQDLTLTRFSFRPLNAGGDIAARCPYHKREAYLALLAASALRTAFSSFR